MFKSLWRRVVTSPEHWRIVLPLGKGRTLHIHTHPWSGWNIHKYKGECTCLDLWFMCFNLSIDYGTCNFEELERKWLGLDKEDDDEYSDD